MYGKDLERFNELYGARNPLEEGHYYRTIDTFCELLTEACKEGENGSRYEELCQDLKKRLPKDVFDTFFGFPTEGGTRKRRVFVCSHCEAIYADDPVTECDCASGAKEFIEGMAEYTMPNDRGNLLLPQGGETLC